MYRNVATRLAYASVEADPISTNPDRKKMTVRPRARSAQDVPGSQVNLASGAAQVPVLLIGGGALAQTYEGATAFAGSDSLTVNQGRKKTVTATSTLTGATSALPRASRAGSYGSTSQPATAVALSGMANGCVCVCVCLCVCARNQPRLSKSHMLQCIGVRVLHCL